MVFSICVCTRNRPESLRRALESLGAQRAPGVEWEALVVDNGSTPRMTESAELRIPGLPLRIVDEPQPGLSIARNRAIQASRGDGLIYIDDDVTLPDGWLLSYAQAFERHPRAVFFGGPIEARVGGDELQSKVRILRKIMPGALSWLDPELPEVRIPGDADLLPWGANMAFRRSALGELRFDPRHGRRPDAPLGSGEETEVLRRLVEAGGFGVWLPSVRLFHHVGAERLSPRYLKEYARGVGWLEGRRQALHPGQHIEGHRNWLCDQRRSKRRKKWRTPPWGPLEARWSALCELAVSEGMLAGFEETLIEMRKEGRE